MRVAKRETLKAVSDLMIFGTGCVFMSKDGADPFHVPYVNMKMYSNEKNLQKMKWDTINDSETYYCRSVDMENYG